MEFYDTPFKDKQAMHDAGYIQFGRRTIEQYLGFNILSVTDERVLKGRDCVPVVRVELDLIEFQTKSMCEEKLNLIYEILNTIFARATQVWITDEENQNRSKYTYAYINNEFQRGLANARAKIDALRKIYPLPTAPEFDEARERDNRRQVWASEMACASRHATATKTKFVYRAFEG